MADHDDHQNQFHLPPPSGIPIVVGVGIAVTLFGLVPDSRLYRFPIVAIGLIIVIGAGWQWLQDAREEYRNLPD